MFPQTPYVPDTLKVPSSALYLTLMEPRGHNVCSWKRGLVRRFSAMFRRGRFIGSEFLHLPLDRQSAVKHGGKHGHVRANIFVCSV